MGLVSSQGSFAGQNGFSGQDESIPLFYMWRRIGNWRGMVRSARSHPGRKSRNAARVGSHDCAGDGKKGKDKGKSEFLRRAAGRKLRKRSSIRCLTWMAVLAFLGMPGAAGMLGQSTPSPAPAQQTPAAQSPQDENPFPGDAPQAPAAKPAQNPKPDAAKPDAAKPASENPFPGEVTDVPIIPVPGGPVAGAPGSGTGGGDAGRIPRRDSNPDGDPVRSPDLPGNFTSDDGFSSSRSGLKGMAAEDDNDARPGNSAKHRTREQTIKEDLDVGSYYLDRKNWKAAQSRFASAFALDAENADAVWGLAEAERHLQLYKDSAEHYKLFLSYDPDGPHGREARKALEEVEAAKPGQASK